MHFYSLPQKNQWHDILINPSILDGIQSVINALNSRQIDLLGELHPSASASE